MATLESGANITLSLSEYDSVTISTRGVVLVEAISGLSVAPGKLAEHAGTRTFGPFTAAGSLKLTAQGRAAQYEIADGAIPALPGSGPTGSNGLSAYELAVIGGFVGTQAAWLASLGAGGSGSGTGINVDDVGYDIIGLAGQSGAEGRGVIDALIELADPRVWQYGCTDGARNHTIFAGNDPNYNPTNITGMSGRGLNTQMSALTVASKVYASMRPSNRRVLYVPVAMGGTPLVGGTALWAAGNPGNALYETAIGHINAAVISAKIQYPNSRYVGTFWHQGESDAIFGVSQVNYVAGLKALIAGFRARITGATNSWLIIGGMVPEAIAASPGGYNPIVAAHQQVASETAKCAYVAGPSSCTDDNLHYNATGCRILGPRMALAVPTAEANTGVAVPATGVTMSGPSGGVISVASTNFTLGVTPAGGTITGTVVVTPSDGGAGGTFTPTTRSLTTAAPTGTFTYTPASTGAKTISVTNSGGLTNPASITYTATASATVPGAPTIGTATAGDTTASVAFTAPASNGGSAITGYTATSSPGGLTGTGATSPISVIGLTNGTPYTFTVVANNGVGPSAASAASNSVTPASAGADLRARAGFTMLTEGGSTGAWTYDSTTETGFNATGAIVNQGLALDALGSLEYTRAINPNGNSDQFQICAVVGTAPLALAGRIMTLVNSSGGLGPYSVFVGSGSATVLNTVNRAVGDKMRIRRSAVSGSTSTLIAEVFPAGGADWIAIAQTTTATNGAINFQLQILGNFASKARISGLAGVGLTAN